MYGIPRIHESRNLKQARPPCGQYVDLLRTEMRSLLPHNFIILPHFFEFVNPLYQKSGAPYKRRATRSSLGELILSHSAKGTFKILRKILEFRTGCYAAVGISDSFVILPATNVANVFFHSKHPFLKNERRCSVYSCRKLLIKKV